MEIDLPPLFLRRLEHILTPHHFACYQSALTTEKMTSFRVNTLKAEVEKIISELKELKFSPEPISWCPDSFYLPASQRNALTKSTLLYEGSIYIQNSSSLFATLVLNPQPLEEILDLAAAPGGKTLHIAALMHNQGRIAAVEPVKDRFFRLKANVNNAKADIVKTYRKDGITIGRLVPERFDRVLLDAPCSSEGRFNLKEPSTFAFWSEKKILEMARKQKQLIHSAIQALKPEGILVYCTCSFAPEENEMIIDHALKKWGDKIEILPFNVPFSNYQPGLLSWKETHFSPAMKQAIRIIPDNKMNGFFICKMRKVGCE